MNRGEFIQKFSLLSLGLTTIPTLLGNSQSRNKIPGLIKDPNGILDLPIGFSYSIISKENDLMDDGLKVPSNADGMTCIKSKDNNINAFRAKILPFLGVFS